MKILTTIIIIAMLPACVHQDTKVVVKQYRGLSEPAARYTTAMLIKCDDFAMQNALTAAKQGYSEDEVLQVYKLAQDQCALKEKIVI